MRVRAHSTSPRRAKSWAGLGISQAFRIERRFRFGGGFLEEGVQFRSPCGKVNELLPSLVVLSGEKESRKVGEFLALLLGQGFANVKKFLPPLAHVEIVASGIAEFQGFFFPTRRASILKIELLLAVKVPIASPMGRQRRPIEPRAPKTVSSPDGSNRSASRDDDLEGAFRAARAVARLILPKSVF